MPNETAVTAVTEVTKLVRCGNHIINPANICHVNLAADLGMNQTGVAVLFSGQQTPVIYRDGDATDIMSIVMDQCIDVPEAPIV